MSNNQKNYERLTEFLANNDKLKELFDDLWDGNVWRPKKGSKMSPNLTLGEWRHLIEEWQKAGFLPPPSPSPSEDIDESPFSCSYSAEFDRELQRQLDALEKEIESCIREIHLPPPNRFRPTEE